MSRKDLEKMSKLLNPFIEIGRGTNPQQSFYVNVETFKDCLGFLLPTKEYCNLDRKKVCSVYAVVGRTVTEPFGIYAYLNIDEPPISRTLMGYINLDVIKKKLPRIYKILKKSRTS